MTLLHVVSNLDAADEWYRRVFGSVQIFKSPHAGVGGMASRHAVADITLEPAAAASTATTNVSRFHTRFGQGLYSTAWLVDDLTAAYRALKEHGVRLYDVAGAPVSEPPGSNAIFTHPKDTFGLIEFASATKHRADPDPWQLFLESPAGNPLTLRAARYIDVAAGDVQSCQRFFVRTLGGSPVVHGRRSGPPMLGCTLSEGVGVPGIRIEQNGRERPMGPSTVAFEVADLDVAATHLARCNVRFTREASRTLRMDPRDAFGVPFVLMESDAPSTDEPGAVL